AAATGAIPMPIPPNPPTNPIPPTIAYILTPTAVPLAIKAAPYLEEQLEKA
ncbi:hypothetical protein H6S82_29645, partial [Planktothrix sp. FACHB-1355]|nr:hypothetical protein [Planktothrix sp. FACHB-1355]